jgi:hypothetical protein
MKRQIIIDLNVQIYKLQGHNKWLLSRMKTTSSALVYQRYSITLMNNKAKIKAFEQSIEIVENA